MTPPFTVAITRLRKLRVFQNQQLTRIVNAPCYFKREVLYIDLKAKPILDHIKDISTKFFQMLPQIRNRLLPAYNPTVSSSQNGLVPFWNAPSFIFLQLREDELTLNCAANLNVLFNLSKL
ncbi:hypothetical protein AVEN_162923-1 [Araneus ventricosus]|uniref:Uncharacterized protein n=1 Tax=Araneus ventricosus TaxID=182803 RepID=A0A4Y2C3B5_ARAVE|nr:hypothetical protein AVEN_70471-1 [Araneus ventricosus]GBL98619.1 hypothetical protein AVEN_162923-1 [Araneus ventricosus]